MSFKFNPLIFSGLDSGGSSIPTNTAIGPGPTVTDNSLARWNGTGGTSLQSSTITLGDTGALVNNLTADVVALSIKGFSSQTNKVFRIERGSNTDEVLSIDNNGSIITMGDLTINNIKTNTQSLIEFGINTDPAWFLHGTTTTADFLSMFKIEINKATNRGLIIKGRTGQTANLQEWRDDADSVLLAISASGSINSSTDVTVNSPIFELLSDKFTVPTTITPGGTTGAQTINKMSGTVNFASGASSLVVTNSFVTTNSIVFAVVRTDDASAIVKNVVPGTGTFTITLNAASAAESSVGFFIING